MEKKIDEIIASIENIDTAFLDKAQERLDLLTKPQGSLGRLEDLAKQVVAIKESMCPNIDKKVIFVFASDHGVAIEGVSAYPQEVTAQMVNNFLAGGAAINVFARHVGAKLVVKDMGVGKGTANFIKGPAMTMAQAITTVKAGIEIFQEEFKKGEIGIIGIGEMGIANTTASSAITAVLTNSKVEEVVGFGTGINEKTVFKKIDVIKRAITLNKPDAANPFDVLSKVGGFEIAGLVGVTLAAAACRVPVIIDGFISTAAALLAYKLEPKVKNYLIASHCSKEPGHKLQLKEIGLMPLFDLGLRLGEGTGAALAMSFVEAAVKMFNQMATFKSAGVSQ